MKTGRTLALVAGCILAAAATGLAVKAGEPAAPRPATPADLKAPAPWLKDIPYRIAFETYRDNNWELFMMNADGSSPVNLTKTPDVNEMYPHLSPDGSKIAFMVNSGEGEATRRSAWYMNLDGTGRVKVADDVRESCWNGNGTAIAILKAEFPAKYVHEDYSSKGVAIYDLASGRLADHPNKDLEHLYNLCWSPDGNWFVSTVHGGMGYSHAILAFEARGAKVFNLDIPGCRPDLSPDGKRIAWGASDWELRVADIDLAPAKASVRNVRTIVKSGEPMMVYHVDWSPDSQYVAFSRGPVLRNLGADPQVIDIKAKGWNICVGNVATGEWVAVTTDGNSNKEPDWVPQGMKP